MFSTNAGLLLFEFLVYAAVALAGWFVLPVLRPRRSAVLLAFRRLGSKPWLSVLAVVAFVLVMRGVFTLVLPTPVPGVHDEFSYLLAGETFAAGRLTNPSHALWQSLETFYVIQKPSYASMYPPAQGLAIALGDKLTGNPWMGIYLSAAAMCGAVCWMLQGWVPPPWALLGGLLAALRLGIYSYWSESYWGGAVAALGGALVIGAVPRMAKKPRVAPSVVLAIGLLVLANSRPFEGILLAIPAFGFLLLRWKGRAMVSFRSVLRSVALPLIAVLGIGAAAMGYYFWRVTNSPLEMPYQLHSKVYEVTGPFLWQRLRSAPNYRYEVMRKYHVERQVAAFQAAHSVRGWLAETGHKAESLLMFYFWPAVLPTLLALPLLRRNGTVQFCLLTLGIMFAGLAVEIWPMTLHYHAPITGVTVLLLVEVMRCWRQIRWKTRPVGLAVSYAIPLLCLVMCSFRLVAAALAAPVPEHGLVPWFTVSPGNLYRERIRAYLAHQPGLQLVFVRYSPEHHVDEEWVHNAADIDRSKIVWARFADEEQNRRVLAYYAQRHAWLVNVGAKDGRLTPLD